MTSQNPSTGAPFNLTSDSSDSQSVDASGVTVAVTFMVALIFVTFQGNLWVLVAIFSNLSLRNSPSSVFVINLMVVGLLASCMVLPLAVAVFVLASRSESTNVLLCDVSGFFNVCFMMCSILSISLISIDRLYSIFMPMHHAVHATLRIYAGVAIIIWVVSAVISSFPLADVTGDWHGLHARSCMEGKTRRNMSDKRFGILVTIISFFIPSLIIVTMYTGVFMMARKAAHKVVPHTPNVTRSVYNENINASTAVPTITAATAQKILVTPSESSLQRDKPSSSNSTVKLARTGCCGDHKDIAPPKTSRAKNVGYPSAKVSPSESHATRPHRKPKQTDTSIFSVAHSAGPEISIAVEHGAKSSDSGGSQTPIQNGCKHQQLHSFGSVDNRARRDCNNSCGRSNANTSDTSVSMSRCHNIRLPCSCQSRSESQSQSSERPGETSFTTAVTGLSGAPAETCCHNAPSELVRRMTLMSLRVPRPSPTLSQSRLKPTYSKALRTVMIIVISFFMFWGAYFVCQMETLINAVRLPDNLIDLALWMGFASYAANPCLYGCMNRQIREQLWLLLRALLRKLRICFCCPCWTFYGNCVTTDPSHAEGPFACCVPPRTPTAESSGSPEHDEHRDGTRWESFTQFLRRTEVECSVSPGKNSPTIVSDAV